MGTNAKTPGKWPSFAKEAKDETKFLLGKIREISREAQLAVLAGQHDRAIVFLGDVRDFANRGIWQLVQAETGLYDDAAAVQDAANQRRKRTD